jgi:hypothetical protein
LQEFPVKTNAAEAGNEMVHEPEVQTEVAAMFVNDAPQPDTSMRKSVFAAPDANPE